jgi:hypothetical protein
MTPFKRVSIREGVYYLLALVPAGVGVLLWLALLGAIMGAAPRPRKVDPEPPRRNPAGDWVGEWDGDRMVVHLDRNGMYHQAMNGNTYSGHWRGPFGTDRRIEVNEWRVPGGPYSGRSFYSLYLSKDGKRMQGGHPGIWLRRVK